MKAGNEGCLQSSLKPLSPRGVFSNVAEGVVNDDREQNANNQDSHDDEVDQEAIEENEESEEGRRPKLRAPEEPTAQEVREHEVTHTPYRSWCPQCIQARGKQNHHRKEKEEPGERAVPSVHVDYWFMRDKPGDPLVPVINIVDEQTGGFKAHVIQQREPGTNSKAGSASDREFWTSWKSDH